MKILLAVALTAATLASSLAGPAFSPEPQESLSSPLQKQMGQRIELRLNSGEKISGKLESVGQNVVHLSALGGMELFEAVVVIDDISAVVVRTPAN